MSDSTTLMSVFQVCDRLTISPATLRRYAISQTDFPRKIHLGPRRIAYRAADVEAYIAARMQSNAVAANA